MKKTGHCEKYFSNSSLIDFLVHDDLDDHHEELFQSQHMGNI